LQIGGAFPTRDLVVVNEAAADTDSVNKSPICRGHTPLAAAIAVSKFNQSFINKTGFDV
jgi:hypothetical protein